MYYLYLKESPLGLMYLGKFTTRKNTKTTVYNYLGSGTVWKNHISKHQLTAEDIKTTVLFTSEDENEFKKVALEYSTRYLVESNPTFANLVPEDGANPCKYVDFSKRATPEYRDKISKALKGKPKSKQHKANMKTFEKGHVPWNKGKTGLPKHSEETSEKRSKAMKQHYLDKFRQELDPIVEFIILDTKQLNYKQIQKKYNLSYGKLKKAREFYNF